MSASFHINIAIVGAGPVGLYVAALLRRAGCRVIMLEQRPELPAESRAIGIHPPSHGLLRAIGVADDLWRRGVETRCARVFWQGKPLIALPLVESPDDMGIYLIPQHHTTAALAECAGHVQYSSRLVACELLADSVRIRWDSPEGQRQATCDWLLACDGNRSTIRDLCGISFQGIDYPDYYIMGDFADNAPGEKDAAVWLGTAGLLESFPLGGGWRRYVAKTASWIPQPTPRQVADCVLARSGHLPATDRVRMVSSFQPHGRFAEHFRQGRVVLLGDAAHIVSPIGGQGMNLGWINAHDFVQALLRDPSATALAEWERSARRRAWIARRRGAFNMWLGRRSLPTLRYLLLNAMLRTPLRSRFVTAFTMRDLAKLSV